MVSSIMRCYTPYLVSDRQADSNYKKQNGDLECGHASGTEVIPPFQKTGRQASSSQKTSISQKTSNLRAEVLLPILEQGHPRRAEWKGGKIGGADGLILQGKRIRLFCVDSRPLQIEQ